MYAYYNSRDLKYKNPFGAIKTEGETEFFIKTEGVFEATLRLWQNEREILIPMEKTEGGFFGRVDMPEKPQLVWYHFILRTDEGTKYYYDNEESFGGEGVLKDCPDGKDYQITVYDKNFKTPKWFYDCVMYQIFPDRFFKGEELPKKREEYILHKDWYEPFSFQKHPFENGPACNDFYGGNLKGIEKKLPYLEELGISVIYLNPIFDAYSNHKYDTADYTKIDPMFGTEEDFKNLCAEAKKRGIRIILDGVFSHTGSDSIYFNKYKNYGEGVGAYQDQNSPYRKWYQFKEGNNYESWWGCTNLPNVNETEPTYLDHILTGKDAIIKKWLRLGASGWRLDVADELPDSFIKTLRKEAKSEKEDCVIIGEVWEDASNKISYSSQREYLLGDELDSVMNYPFKDSMIDFIKGYINAPQFEKRIMKILENYPKEVSYSLMNMAGTHDTPRIKTVLGTDADPSYMSDEEKWNFSLKGTEETLAIERLMLMAFMQMTFVGVPSIYYGDEIGMEGFRDPYNRKPYSWRNINPELLEYYKELIKLRNENDFLKRGTFVPLYAKDKVFAYLREIKNEKDVFGEKAKNGAGLFVVNCGEETAHIKTEELGEKAKELLKNAEEIAIMPRKMRFFIGK
ncbi:MAG: glycoside hydrolase family 13 protein [Clostridia bacterium]|nr:glycoside hydrolase family 13 protein [Clostridia bacterium]